LKSESAEEEEAAEDVEGDLSSGDDAGKVVEGWVAAELLSTAVPSIT
jgi:hypothetical protein